MSAHRRVALVTGANRGIGLEVTRGLVRRGMSVVAGARDLELGEEAVGPLREEGLDVEVRRLDVTDAASVAAVMEELERERGRLDVLVNNAGVLAGEAALKVPLDVAEEMLRVNALGPWRVCQAAAPLMRRAGYGRIVNVSSGAGSLAGMGTYAPPYSVSKAALNAVTRVLAAELRGTGVLVNSVCPGWVRTDMGGPGASRSVEEGAAGILWAALLPDDGPTGGFFRDGEPVPW